MSNWRVFEPLGMHIFSAALALSAVGRQGSDVQATIEDSQSIESEFRDC